LIGTLLIIITVYFILFIVILVSSLKKTSFLPAFSYTLAFLVILIISSSYLTKIVIDKLLTIHYMTTIFYYIISFMPTEYLVLIINLMILTIIYNIGSYIYDMLLPEDTGPLIQKREDIETQPTYTTQQSLTLRIGGEPKPKIKSLSQLSRTRQPSKSEPSSKFEFLSKGIKTIVSSEEGSSSGNEIEEVKRTTKIGEGESNEVIVDEQGNIVFIDTEQIQTVEKMINEENKVTQEESDELYKLLSIDNIEDIGEIRIKSKKDVILLALRELSKFIMFEQIASDPNKVNDPRNYKLLSGPKPLKSRKKSSAGWLLEIGFKISPMEYYIFKVYVAKNGKNVKIKPIEVKQMI